MTDSKTKRYVGKLSLLVVTDVYVATTEASGVGGWAQLKTLVDKRRAECKNSLFVLPGDLLGGSPLAEFDSGHSIIDILNHLDVDAACLGNHEFDFGPEKLMERQAESQFAWLGSNVRSNVTGQLIGHTRDHLSFKLVLDRDEGQGHLIRCPETNGVNGRISHQSNEQTNNRFDKQPSDDTHSIDVLMFGLCTSKTPQLSFPGPDISFEDTESTASRIIKSNSASLNIAVTHLSMFEDRKLARAIPTLDVICGGHDHEPIQTMEGQTLIFKAGQNGEWLGEIELNVEVVVDEANPQGKFSVNQSWHMWRTYGYQPDSLVESVIADANARLDAARASVDLEEKLCVVADGDWHKALTLNNRPIDQINMYYTSEDPRCHVFTVYRSADTGAPVLSTLTQECRSLPGGSVFAELIADALMEHYTPMSCDGGIINGGFIRGNAIYEAGHMLTMRDVLTELPFPRPAVLIELPGHALLLGFEQMLSSYPRAVGHNPHISHSMRFTFDANTHRIDPNSFFVGGSPLNLEATYKIAMTTFLFGGGDGLTAFKDFGKKLNSDSFKISEVLQKFLRRLQRVQPVLQNRIYVKTD